MKVVGTLSAKFADNISSAISTGSVLLSGVVGMSTGGTPEKHTKTAHSDAALLAFHLFCDGLQQIGCDQFGRAAYSQRASSQPWSLITMLGTLLIILIILIAWVSYSVTHYRKQKERHVAQNAPGEHKRGSDIQDLT